MAGSNARTRVQQGIKLKVEQWSGSKKNHECHRTDGTSGYRSVCSGFANIITTLTSYSRIYVQLQPGSLTPLTAEDCRRITCIAIVTVDPLLAYFRLLRVEGSHFCRALGMLDSRIEGFIKHGRRYINGNHPLLVRFCSPATIQQARSRHSQTQTTLSIIFAVVVLTRQHQRQSWRVLGLTVAPRASRPAEPRIALTRVLKGPLPTRTTLPT